MGLIKEPKGVDFVINSRPLTKDEEASISNYIREYKEKHSSKIPSTNNSKKVSKRNKVVA